MHRLEVVLVHSRPRICRQLEVPSVILLAHLHEVIQIAMGWKNTHPFRFPYHEDFLASTPLAEVAPNINNYLDYVYDVPDAYGIGGWKVGITVLKVSNRKMANPPLCTSGRRAGPPQNSGGIYRFHFLLSLSPSERRLRGESFKRGFKPAIFNKTAINKKLASWAKAKLMRSKRPSTTKKRAALYHRVSTIDQDPTAARRELREAAKRYDLRVTLDVEETGSGANNSRPGLMEVMEAAQRGKIDAVLVWKLDRFGRSALDLLAHLRELESAGVRFVSITQGIDLRPGGEAMSRLMLTMLGAVAEFERELIVERTKLGLARARDNGKTLGRPRAPRPPTRRVLSLRRKGYTWPEIAEELGCSVWAARQAEKGPAEKGGQNGPQKRARTGRSEPV